MDQENLKEILAEANRKYRNGEDSGLTDQEYDDLLERVTDQEFKSKVGIEVTINKTELPVGMGSMCKVKEYAELRKWLTKLNLHPVNERLIVTPKFDGLALLVEFKNGKFSRAITRGDGAIGQDVTEHYKTTKLALLEIPFMEDTYFIGETIMSNPTFDSKYSKEYKNPRNLVAGIIGRKHIDEKLCDIDFLAFDVKFKGGTDESDYYNESSKYWKLTKCNALINKPLNGFEVPFLSKTCSEISESELNLFKESITDYACDGLVIDISKGELRKELGTETNSLNPKYARAWKPQVEETAAAVITDITWRPNKTGKITPVVQIAPVDLGGCTISNVTAYNAKFVQDNELQEGTTVLICRSGDVIPKILKVVSQPEDQLFNVVPKSCPSCSSDLKWNETNVDLHCENAGCSAKGLREVISFFSLLEVDSMGSGTIEQLWNEGYDSVEKILKMRLFEFQDLDRFGDRKAEKVYRSIHSKMQNVKLNKLQHASNLFKGLGSRKLGELLKYNSKDNKPTLDEIVALDGFSKKSAESYLAGFDIFWEWVEKLPVTIDYSIPVEETVTDGSFSGDVVVFTGFRSPDLEAKIKAEGGSMGSGINKKTTILVVKSKESTSSKMKKATDMGITVLSRTELEQKIEEANPLFDL
jgi:NAD-dependent DNA ligase